MVKTKLYMIFTQTVQFHPSATFADFSITYHFINHFCSCNKKLRFDFENSFSVKFHQSLANCGLYSINSV